MKTIWKFLLDVTEKQHLQIPLNAKILCVQAQHETPCLWALVDTTIGFETITLETFGTGHNIPEGKREFISTYQLKNGALVFHVFKVTE